MFFCNNSYARQFLSLWERETEKAFIGDQEGVNNILLKYSPLEKYYEIVNIEGIKVKILPAEIYNFFYFPEDMSKAKVLHYKGANYKNVYN
jgi:hypothetical protein